MKLDGDLETWLDHPCDTPALRVGASTQEASTPIRAKHTRAARTARTSVDRDTLKSDGDITPNDFFKLMQASVQAIKIERDRLNELDGAIGDGDHGITMEIGWKAVEQVLNASDDATITELCEDIADAFLETVGASAGPLYSSGFKAAGQAVSDRLNLDASALAAWVAGMAQGIKARGGAEVGQKTMVDAWAPAAEAAQARLAAGGTSSECLAAAAEAASDGAAGTKEMLSQMGRSKKLGDRSKGHVDPGAESAAVLLRTWSQTLG